MHDSVLLCILYSVNLVCDGLLQCYYYRLSFFNDNSNITKYIDSIIYLGNENIIDKNKSKFSNTIYIEFIGKLLI